MQQSKFEQARAVVEDAENEEPTCSSFTSMLETPSPVNTRKGSAKYYKKKLNALQGKVASFIQDAEIDLEEVPGFYEKNKVKPLRQNNEKPTRITQMSGSMTAKKAIEKVREIKEKKDEAESKRAKAKENKDKQFEAFVRCREECLCKSVACQAKGLKQCPVCKNVMKSNCSKAKCKKDGKNPTMILPAKARVKVAAKKKLIIDEDSYSENSDNSDEVELFSDSGEETETDDEIGEETDGGMCMDEGNAISTVSNSYTLRAETFSCKAFIFLYWALLFPVFTGLSFSSFDVKLEENLV